LITIASNLSSRKERKGIAKRERQGGRRPKHLLDPKRSLLHKRLPSRGKQKRSLNEYEGCVGEWRKRRKNSEKRENRITGSIAEVEKCQRGKKKRKVGTGELHGINRYPGSESGDLTRIVSYRDNGKRKRDTDTAYLTYI